MIVLEPSNISETLTGKILSPPGAVPSLGVAANMLAARAAPIELPAIRNMSLKA
jgi:hypothetical protein